MTNVTRPIPYLWGDPNEAGVIKVAARQVLETILPKQQLKQRS